MNKLLVMLGIVLLNTPAVLACEGKPVQDASNHSAFSREYAQKYDLPPTPGLPDDRNQGGGTR